MTQFFIYFGDRYHLESEGKLGIFINHLSPKDLLWDDIKKTLAKGDAISIRPANPYELYCADLILDEVMDRQSDADPERYTLTSKG